MHRFCARVASFNVRVFIAAVLLKPSQVVLYIQGALNCCGGQVRLWLSQKRAEVLLPTQLGIEVASGVGSTRHQLCSLRSTLSDIFGRRDIHHVASPAPSVSQSNSVGC